MTFDRDMPPAIELSRITKTYKRRLPGGRRNGGLITALDNIDLRIGRGELFGVVGQSGSGKTTAGRLITRLEKPDSGSIRLSGQDITRLRGKALKSFRQKVQMIFQDPYQSLNPYLSVVAAVSEPLGLMGRISKEKRIQKVIDTLTTVGLTPIDRYLNCYPHQLSGGQRQRVSIARAVILDPEVLVADEPTSMLDASMSVQIYQLLSDIQKKRGVTLVFITHSLATAHYLCDRVAVIYRGHIVECGPAGSVIAAPRHPYTQALLDALPKYGHLWPQQRYNALLSQERTDAAPLGCIFYHRCNKALPKRCAGEKPMLRPVGDHVHVACFLSGAAALDAAALGAAAHQTKS